MVFGSRWSLLPPPLDFCISIWWDLWSIQSDLWWKDSNSKSFQTCEFTQFIGHSNLINDVEILSKELGFFVIRKNKNCKCTNSINNDKIFKAIRLYIHGDFSVIPTKIKRKIAKNNINKKINDYNILLWNIFDTKMKILPQDFTMWIIFPIKMNC